MPKPEYDIVLARWAAHKHGMRPIEKGQVFGIVIDGVETRYIADVSETFSQNGILHYKVAGHEYGDND